MSKRDLQFIERALAHPWMFWIYFWKWPRIVRQACAEYDLLAKERDAAKEAHEQAVRANKIVRDWIHVTHRLDMTADMRAIWTAGKRLSALLLFLALTLSASAQLPPILRNQWTTNANPLALKVISTNGVHAATNIWEVDFTNTATVTVSAVSNANKVMVSFTGGGGGESIWTNYSPFVAIIADTNRVRHFPTKTEFGTNADNTVTITNGGVGIISYGQQQGSGPADSSGNRVTTMNGSFAGADFYFATNCYIENIEGGFGGGFFQESINCYATTRDGGYTGIQTIHATNCFIDGTSSLLFGFFGDSGSGGTKDSSIQASPGTFGIANIETSSNVVVRPQSHSMIGASVYTSDNVTIQSKGGITSATLFNSRDVSVASAGGGVSSALLVGSFNSATNSTLSGTAGIGVGSFTGQSNSVIATDGLAFGRVASNERILAQGSSSVAAFALGRNVVSTNNWTFGIHYTNTVPLSLAVGANGTTQFRAASNSVVVRSATAPTVGQILTATDTSGTVGWSNAPASSGEATTNGAMQPFDLSKTWLVFMGDSISTTVGTAFVPYATHATNFAWWRGVAFSTNQATGGNTFVAQTNIFMTNTLPLLPAVATNGTNVIITIQAGLNDFLTDSFLTMRTNHIAFVDFLHSRGYTVVRTTILPSEPKNDTTYTPILQFNNWVRSASNYFDRVADFARRLPDNSNLEFYTNDFIHPVTLGSYELAKEWDTSVRYMTWPHADLIERIGHTWEARDHDGTFRLSIGSEFWGSNSVNGVFFSGDLSANQVGIFMTNSGNQDLIYNVVNAQAHVFKEGDVEILRLAETGLTTPMLTLTGTGDALTTTGLVFNNAGGTGNDVGIWRDTDNLSIHYKVGQGSFTGPGHTWYLGDTQYLTVRLNGAYANATLTSLAPTNRFSGYLMVTNGIKVGLANQATITNILSGSATLDFPSTSSGAVADLAITVTGAASGDVVSVGVPQGSATGIIGSYSGFASNNTVFVRFVPTAATQDPASGTFRALVTKVQ